MNGLRMGVSALIALGITALAWGASAQDKLPPPEDAPPGEKASPGDPKGPVTDTQASARDTRAPVKDAKAPAGEKEPVTNATAQPKDKAPAVIVGFGMVPERQEEAPAPERARRVWTPVEQHWSAGLGFLGNNVPGEGFQPYSTNRTLPMASVFGTYTPWFSRPFSIHLAGEWNFGEASAAARGAQSSLTVNRLALGLEGRAQPLSRMRLFVRLMPGAIHESASLQDAYLGNRLEGSAWTWGLDMTAGAAARIGAVGHPDGPAASFWISLDLGYRLSGNATLKLRPADLTEDDQTRTFGDVSLPSIDLSGFIGKVAFSASF